MSLLTVKTLSTQISAPTSTHYHRVDANEKDIAMLQDILNSGVFSGNEDNQKDLYLNGLIEKPWGEEYRAYVDDFIDIWHLKILPGESTSTHAHPRKTTYLICIAGEGVNVSLGGEIPLQAGTILRIGRGAFHATRCLAGKEPLMLLEVETPRNKFDLVRMSDNYQRSGQKYEPEGKVLEGRRKKIPNLPNASLVHSSPCRKFKFSVQTGMELFYQRSSVGSLAICLSLRGVLSENISIITPTNLNQERIQTDAQYLCVESVKN